MTSAGGLATDPRTAGGRLGSIDALRGLASLSVLCHHLLHNTVLEEPLREVLPDPVTWFQGVGAHGVEVFFVLSGFVILLSLQRTALTAPSTGRFVVRRQARLDPPYWTMIAVALAVLALERALGYVVVDDVTATAVLANLFYLQNILRQPEILAVAWTLCLEVQFYLVLIALLVVPRLVDGARGRGASADRPRFDARRRSLPVILFATGTASLVGSWAFDEHVMHTWAIGTWHVFAVGALLYLARFRPRRRTTVLVTVLVALEGVTFVAGLGVAGRASTAAALLAVVFIVGCWWWTAADRWVATNRPLQYLGSRSYSIYLVHLTVLTVVMRFGFKVTGADPTAALAWMLVSIPACLLVAEVLHRFVERPAVRLSKEIRDAGVGATIKRWRRNGGALVRWPAPRAGGGPR